MNKTVGIIGFGRFGKLTANILKPFFHIYIYDNNIDKKQLENNEFNFVDLKTCASKDIVLLCVPISSFEEVVKRITPFLKKGTLVIDVCSVKEMPVSIMKNNIPAFCECIGTHPLFGPDTVHHSLKGKKIVICPVKITNLAPIKSFLEKLNLTVITISARDHDYQMAKSLALIHFLGRGLDSIGVKQISLATPTHTTFINLIDIVRHDSKQLFLDMHTYNRFTKEVRRNLIEELIRLDGELDG